MITVLDCPTFLIDWSDIHPFNKYGNVTVCKVMLKIRQVRSDKKFEKKTQ